MASLMMRPAFLRAMPATVAFRKPVSDGSCGWDLVPSGAPPLSLTAFPPQISPPQSLRACRAVRVAPFASSAVRSDLVAETKVR